MRTADVPHSMALGYRILSYPVNIINGKYFRNHLLFNLVRDGWHEHFLSRPDPHQHADLLHRPQSGSRPA
jgi:hypothetical protein